MSNKIRMNKIKKNKNKIIKKVRLNKKMKKNQKMMKIVGKKLILDKFKKPTKKNLIYLTFFVLNRIIQNKLVSNFIIKKIQKNNFLFLQKLD